MQPWCFSAVVLLSATAEFYLYSEIIVVSWQDFLN